MSNEIAIISAPDANEDQVRSLIYALDAEGKLPFPVYITRARMTPISKKDILDWLATLATISVSQGWGKEAAERLKNIEL